MSIIKTLKRTRCASCGKYISYFDLADKSKVIFVHTPDHFEYGYPIAEKTDVFHNHCYPISTTNS